MLCLFVNMYSHVPNSDMNVFIGSYRHSIHKKVSKNSWNKSKASADVAAVYLWVCFGCNSSPSSSRACSLPPLSIPEVCELSWLLMELPQVCSGWRRGCPSLRKLSVSMPDVWELPWLTMEWRERHMCRDMLPVLLPLARERLSRCSMSSSRASLMYDSRYCFFSARRVTHLFLH